MKLNNVQLLTDQSLSSITGGGKSDYEAGKAYGKMIGYGLKAAWFVRFL